MIFLKRKLKIFIILFILLILYVYVANITLFPKSILLIQGEKLNLATLWGISLKENSRENSNIGEWKTEKTKEASSVASDTTDRVGKIDLNLNIFQIPISEVSVNVVPKTKVIPLRIGYRFKTIYRRCISCRNDRNRRKKAI